MTQERNRKQKQREPQGDVQIPEREYRANPATPTEHELDAGGKTRGGRTPDSGNQTNTEDPKHDQHVGDHEQRGTGHTEPRPQKPSQKP